MNSMGLFFADFGFRVFYKVVRLIHNTKVTKSLCEINGKRGRLVAFPFFIVCAT
ncbi:hypothetical protein KsCSTR_47220 [Candidatus Kuenenia stuttgartiensis]|uniref:Uncharacterized protein n=1 Tax=Kuenenia stuttgartiensis TaxID=174633 RepID=A0A6G7GXV7_KUEST|nr:hypothetical protein KsCSTR_47220 [Candidatus Kuenenia stuttgartiensis]